MTIEILNRWTHACIWSGEVETRRAGVEAAVKSGANLSGANLYGANLYRADLSGANLYRADLYGADLSDADLSDADLSGALLEPVAAGSMERRARVPDASLKGLRGQP